MSDVSIHQVHSANLRKLRLAMVKLDTFTVNELYDVTGVSTLAAANYVGQCHDEGLLAKVDDHRYRLRDLDARKHLLELNLASFKFDHD